MNIRQLICRLLAQLGYFPKGCPPKPPGTIGADKVRVTINPKKDH